MRVFQRATGDEDAIYTRTADNMFMVRTRRRRRTQLHKYTVNEL